MAKRALKPGIFRTLRNRLQGIGLLLDEMDEEGAERFVEAIIAAPAVFVSGKGRSGLVAACFAMRLMQMGCNVHVPSEVTCPPIRKGDLMVAISCSGKTMTTVQLARIAREQGAHVVAITAVADSPLTALADQVVMVPVMTRKFKKGYGSVLGPYNNSLFEEALLLYLDVTVYAMLARQGIPEQVLRERHTNLE